MSSLYFFISIIHFPIPYRTIVLNIVTMPHVALIIEQILNLKHILICNLHVRLRKWMFGLQFLWHPYDWCILCLPGDPASYQFSRLISWHIRNLLDYESQKFTWHRQTHQAGFIKASSQIICHVSEIKFYKIYATALNIVKRTGYWFCFTFKRYKFCVCLCVCEAVCLCVSVPF